ncbi:shikimate kinase family protein [Dorcoceras hygrometricum]|uniref:Shikimate kinase family protein n=1 Tax=Dorcoceras hygrometricum TaxID=472368 RepID=A0A2Z7CC69_9LAMI|nr:shikimate kinase family protein [Dorcoceras hygrometricum]
MTVAVGTFSLLCPPCFPQFSRFSGRAFPISIFSAICTAPVSAARAVLQNSTSDFVVAKVAEADRLLAIKKRASEISSNLKGTSIFLVGMNSSYKSNLGVILADAFRYYYFDSDSLVEEAAGGKDAAISLVEREEEGYLASETEVLKQLSSMGRLIVCAGNGAVKSSSNLALLRHGISIWIDVPLDLVARDIMEDRIQLSASDTILYKSSDEILDRLTTLYDSGRSGYSTADATISLQKLATELGYDELQEVTVEDMCMEVLKEIERLVRVKKMMEEAARPF